MPVAAVYLSAPLGLNSLLWGGERGGKRFQFGYHSSSIPLQQKVASFAIDMFWYLEKFQEGY